MGENDSDEDVGAEEFATWLTPSAAVQKLRPWEHIVAKENLVSRLASGILSACSERLLLQGRGPLLRREIPKLVWQEDAPNWNSNFWVTGTLEAEFWTGGRKNKITAFNVRFRPSAIAEIVAENAVASEPEAPRAIGAPAAPVSQMPAKPILETDLNKVAQLVADLFGIGITEVRALEIARACFPDRHVAQKRFLTQYRRFRPDKKRGKQPLNHID